MGALELARPAEQQPVLQPGVQHHLQTGRRRGTRRALLQLQRLLHLCFVDALAAQEANQNTHAESLAQQ